MIVMAIVIIVSVINIHLLIAQHNYYQMYYFASAAFVWRDKSLFWVPENKFSGEPIRSK
jgi:hypothetical protein